MSSPVSSHALARSTAPPSATEKAKTLRRCMRRSSSARPGSGPGRPRSPNFAFMNDSPRLLEQLDPPRRREGYWIAGGGVLVAIVASALLLKSGRGEPIQTTTLASAVVSTKTAPPPPPAQHEES